MEVPEQLVKDLTAGMESADIPVPDSQERWTMALDALKVLHCCLYETETVLYIL